MSPAAQLFHARIERRAAALAPELRRALLRAYARLAKVLTETQMEVFIRDPSALRLLELEAEIQKALAPASRALRDGVEAAGQAVAKELPGAAQGTTFNVLNPKVLAAIRDLDRRVMGAITTEVQGVVRAVVERGLQEGIGPRQMARMVQSSVGLAENQLAAVVNFRKMLEEGNAEALTRTLRDRRFDAMIKRAMVSSRSDLAQLAAEGIPREGVFFHGTGARFAQFDAARAQGFGSLGRGIYLADTRAFADRWVGRNNPDAVGRVYTVRANLRNTADLLDPQLRLRIMQEAGITFPMKLTDEASSIRLSKYLSAKGYDSARIGGEFVVFDANRLTVIAENVARGELEIGRAEALGMLARDKLAGKPLPAGASEMFPELNARGLTPDQIDRMTEAYRNRMAAFHAETLTRTAALDAQRVGHQLTWEDAVARGDINGETLTKRWSGTLDDRERDTHLIMEGETVPYDQPYSNGQMVPGEGEYNCRCVSIFETRGKLNPGAGKRGVTAKQLRVGPALAGVA